MTDTPTPAQKPAALTHWQSLRFYLFEPWWRAVWFIGAIVWAVIFNVLYITIEPRDELLGVISVIPIFAFLFEQQSRARKLRQSKKTGISLK